MAAKRALFETLKDLSSGELEDFNLLVGLKKGAPLRSKSHTKVATTEDMVELMVETYSQDCFEVTKKALKRMNRTDLVQRLSDSNLGTIEKQSVCEQRLPSLDQRVETVMSVMDQLMETLAYLSEEELVNFNKTYMRRKCFHRDYGDTPWRLFMMRDHQDTVFLMMLTCGQHFVETTMEVLKEIKRTDLVQRLLDTSSGFKKEHSEEHRSAQIWKVAEMAAVKQLLLETLKDLRNKELMKFMELLQLIFYQKHHPDILPVLLNPTDRAEIVNLMVNTYGRQSVEETREVLKEMNRTDLMQRLPETSSGPKEKHSEDEDPTMLDKADVKWIILETLRGLRYRELEKFKWLLQLTYFQKSLPQIPLSQMLWTDAGVLLDQIMKRPQCLQVTREVLMDMNRHDLVTMLSGTISGHKERDEPQQLQKESTLTSAREKLLETLEDLSLGELEKFKRVLLYTKNKEGLPKIPRHRLETAGRAETVELMVEIYGLQCVEVTKEVLEKIGRTDLVEKFSESSSGSREPLRSLELEDCGHIVQHSRDWTILQPTAVQVSRTDGDEFQTYSLQSEAGNYFECSVSGLRWVCKEKVSFKYQFCSWEGHMERMESINYMPAGPLMNIEVIAGKFDEVHLPHWVCIDHDPEILKEFAVLHIEDCGDVVQKVSEVTPSHVKLSEPVFSPRAVLMKASFHVKIGCSVLIYYRPNTPFLKLHVYLIPCDPALQQTVDKKEVKNGYKIIPKPRPDKHLKMQQGFSLSAGINTARIAPKIITLRYDSLAPNFYEVFIEKPDRNFHLTLSNTRRGKAQPEEVWTCEIRGDDYQSPSSEDKHSVDDQPSALVQEAVTTSDRERLLNLLKDLKQEEFKEFKFYLQDRSILAGLPHISTSDLENKDMLDIVDLMFRINSQQCMVLTKKILKTINRNDLEERLSDIR
uniref:uncharacterized protein n=1 Tax=Semicossyphus pulcher TaxID=241346 RepID=UPI0037E74FC4